MVTSDVEVEDAEKKDFDVVNANVQDSESKCSDEVNIQGNGESAVKVYAVDMVVDVTESENGEGVLEQRDGAKEEISLKCEMKAPLVCKNEACETKGVDGFNDQLVFNKTEDKGIQIEMDNRSQAAAENLSQKQNDAIEEKSSVGGVEEMDAENGVGSEHLDVGMEEENPYGETVAEKTCERDGNCVGHVAGEELSAHNNVTKDDQDENKDPSKLPSDKDSQCQNGQSSKFSLGEDNGREDADKVNEYTVVKDEVKEQNNVIHSTDVIDGHNDNVVIVPAKHEGEEDSSAMKQIEIYTPSTAVRYSAIAGEHGSQAAKPVHTQATIPLMVEDDNGTPEEQAAFMKEIESFYRAAAIDYKPPKFYGQPLNCLKLWRAVIRLGGYDRVTGSKLWRQVGESFHPPKTCTTVSWTFRIFYEKSLLEYERHKVRTGEVQLPVSFPEASGVDIEGSGKAKRDASGRATQGWHAQRNGDVGGPVVKDKSLINMEKREKGTKGMGSLKQKRPNEVDHPVKAARIETPRQLAAQVVDIGPPADWVKINVRESNDSFEVYCLVPGLLREEVRVQSDPAGRLVITGQPEQVNNPWGITPFKKVVSLPGRIDPLETSAVVSLHGRLFVRVPFEKPAK